MKTSTVQKIQDIAKIGPIEMAVELCAVARPDKLVEDPYQDGELMSVSQPVWISKEYEYLKAKPIALKLKKK